MVILASPDEEPKGPEPGITGPSILTRIHYPATDDYLVYGLGVDWSSSFNALLEFLDEERYEPEMTGEPVEIQRGGKLFFLHGTGKKAGVGHYRYKIEHRGVWLYLKADNYPKSDAIDNVRVEIGGTPILCAGSVWECVRDAHELLEALGAGSIEWTKVSRWDGCIDLPGIDSADLCEFERKDKFVSRSRDTKCFKRGRRTHAVQFGKGDVICRIYDKLLETANDEVKRARMVEYRWGGSCPSRAARVEFQLRRAALKEFGVNTLEELRDLRGGVMRAMCESWLRLTDEVPDKHNPHRAQTAELWRIVQEAVENGFGTADIVQRRREVKPVIREKLLRQAGGILARLYTDNHPAEDCYSLPDLTARVICDLWLILSPEEFREMMERARRKTYMAGQHLEVERGILRDEKRK